MASKLEEIVLTFERERIRFDAGCEDPDEPSTCILECSPIELEQQQQQQTLAIGSCNVKTECRPSELSTGLQYRFYGRWTSHPKYGRQFDSRTFVKVQPRNRVGTIRYLMQAPGIGQKTATTLWDKFNGDAVRIVREQPDVAACAVGGQFNELKAAEAAGYLRREAALEATTIDLMELLAGRGFPRNLGKRAVAEWGNKAAEIIRRSPYSLMRFRGCGFLRCDQLFLDLGGDPRKLKRQALAAWHAIARDTNGNTWHQPAMVERGLAERIGGAKVDAVPAVKLAKRGKLLATHRNGDGRLWLAEAGKAKNEATVAERVRSWLTEAASWPDVANLDISDHQRKQLGQALTCPLAVFGGGPGTGKTYSAARLIAEIIRIHGTDQVAVAAPTGKAAVRISEVMTGYGVKVRAKTIHSLLRVASKSEGEGWGFEHDEHNPLPQKFIVVDESSMIDVDLAAALFRACAVGCHVLLVGDTGQLPPVGHGAPLRDLIAASVPTGILTEIRRNAGDIVRACHEIRGGRKFLTSRNLDPDNGENLRLKPAVSSRAALEQIVKTIHAIGNRGLVNPIWECQVIVAVNAKSELSRKDVNERLQRELNPGGTRSAGNPFRVGDKIVCLKNGFYHVVDDAPVNFNAEKSTDGKVFVANGEQAAVKFVEPKLTVAQLDAPSRLVKIPRGAGQDGGDDGSGSQGSGGDGGTDISSAIGCQWDLAYAISCHKSQGSEWPIVLVALDEYPGARLVCSREWLYTAASRAKKVCFLVGKLSTAHGMIAREAIGKRKTFLRELIVDPQV